MLALNLNSPVQILLHDHCALFQHYRGEATKNIYSNDVLLVEQSKCVIDKTLKWHAY